MYAFPGYKVRRDYATALEFAGTSYTEPLLDEFCVLRTLAPM